MCCVHVSSLQVLRDSSSRGVNIGEKVTVHEKVEWRKLSTAFLEECKRDEQEEETEFRKKTKPLDRLATFYLMHSTDWQMQVCGMKGYIEFFASKTKEGCPIEERPLLVECQDSYSVNTCKVHYLVNKRECRMMPIWDFFHKRHNMKLAAYKQSGVWASVRLQMSVFEVFRGPWGGYKFWRETVEATRAYLALVHEDDPIFELEFEAICRTRGLDTAIASKSDLLNEMKTAKWLDRLAPKSCSGRWCSFEDSQTFWHPHLAERLCGTRFLGMQQGWHDKQKDVAKSMLHHLKAHKPAGKAESSDKKEGMAETAVKETRVREKCVNGLHFAAVVMSNDDVQFDAAAARYIADASVHVHKHWTHFLKGSEQGVALAVACASGALSHQVLKGTLKCLSDQSELQKLGLQTDFAGKRWRSLTRDSPEVQNEDEMMRRLASLVRAFCEEEIKFLAMWRSTLPFGFAAFLDKDADLPKLEHRLRQIHKGYKEAQKSTMTVWKGVAKCSQLNWVICKETMELFESADYKFGERQKKQVRRLFSHMMSSLLSERGFKWMRDSQRDNNSTMVSEMTLWECPSRRGVLDQHEFPELKSDYIRDVGKQTIAKSFFGPAMFRKSSDKFSDLPGRGAAAWHSAKANDLHLAGAQQDLLFWAMEKDKMGEAAASWRTCVVQTGCIIVRVSEPDKKYFCLGKSLCMMYLWPAEEVHVGAHTFYQHSKDEGIDHLLAECVIDLDEWASVPTECVSPASIYLMNDRKPLKELPLFPALVTGPQTSLLHAAARSAFSGMHKAALLKLDKEEIESVTTETKLGDILLCMIKATLKCTMLEAADILAQRCIRVAADERREMIASEAFEEITHEKKEVDRLTNELDHMEKEADECVEAVRIVRTDAKKKPEKKAKLADKVWPAKHEFTILRLLAVQPPGARFWYDARLRRYQVFYEGSSFSRAVRTWGEHTSAKECTRWAWTMHALLCDARECPVKGLF